MAIGRKVGSVSIDLSLDRDNVKKDFNYVKKETEGAARQLKRTFKTALGGVGAYLGIRELAQFANQSINLARQQIQAETKVRQAIESTGKAAGFTAKELFKLASERQKLTGIGDEKILNDVTAQLLTFTNIAQENFKRTQNAVLDLSTVLEGDLKSASIQLGKALNDPVANLGALGRSGIQFSDEQTKMIKTLATSNRLFEAQTIILDELDKQYGGQAESAAKADRGLKQMTASIGDAQEDFGKWLINGISPAYEGMQDLADSVGEFFKQLSESDLETATRQLQEFGVEAEKIAQLTALNTVLEARKELKELGSDLSKLPKQLNELKNPNTLVPERVKDSMFGSNSEMKEYESLLQDLISDSITFEEKQKLIEDAAAKAGKELSKLGDQALSSEETKELEKRAEQYTKQSKFLTQTNALLLKQKDLKDQLTTAEKILSGEEIKNAEDRLTKLKDEEEQTESTLKEKSEYFEKVKFYSADYLTFRTEQIVKEAEAVEKATGDMVAAEIWKYQELKKLGTEWMEWFKINIKPTLQPELNLPTELEPTDGQEKPNPFDSSVEGLENMMQLQDALESGYRSMAQTAASAAGTMFEGLERANSVVLQLIGSFGRAIVQALILKTVMGLFGLPGGFSGISVFGGGKASGGPVVKGVAYEVGERGRELFVPNENGYIIPNDALNKFNKDNYLIGVRRSAETSINTSTNNFSFNDRNIINAIDNMRGDLKVLGKRIAAYNANVVTSMYSLPPINLNIDGRTIAKTSESNLNTLQREGVNRENL